ncbi:MAG: hypothetical protein BWY17_00925 [Deltaproteobacteria bacterium ADurb.Bin207]|jgi:hypothetical protein|nr:MAG: hypothetical protein BWY17_00925 [Deltaproteobacteria bacterium ADurb.Bin207]
MRGRKGEPQALGGKRWWKQSGPKEGGLLGIDGSSLGDN